MSAGCARLVRARLGTVPFAIIRKGSTLRKKKRAFALLSTCVLAGGCSSNNPVFSPGPTPISATSVVWTETNAANGNAVLAYTRGLNGSLTSIGSTPTGGNGVGLPTAPGALPFPIGGATGAVTLAPGGTHLYVADAGTDDVAAFTVSPSGTLALIARYPTGGTAPASITVDASGRFLYVLNTGSLPSGNNVPGGITGFTIAANGSLSPIPGSTQTLSARQYVDPSEVAFSPDGSYLVVTEKATNRIDIFPAPGGVAGPAVSRPSTGNIPFGFGFTPSGTLVVSNAESAQPGNTASTVSSYSTNAGGALTVISGAVPDNQGAACWITLTSDGAFAYAVNTLSGSLSGYTVGSNGTLKLLTPGGVTAAQPNTTGPIDNIVTPDNRFLYVLNSMAGKSPGAIAGFAIGSGGSLTSVPVNVTGLPPGSIGLAVR